MRASIPFPDISPEIFSFSVGGFEFALRWYALAYIVGIVAGWQIIAWLMRRPKLWPESTPPMTPTLLENFMTWIIIAVILGGRLGYVFFYAFDAFAADPLSIIRVWEGGMSFHGGFAGVIVATILYARRYKLPLGSVADSLAIVAPLGLLLGRIANFINGELWGRVTDVTWGVVFPGEAAQNCLIMVAECARHPSQLYEAGLEGLLLGTLIAWLALKRGGLRKRWFLTGLFFLGYGLSRYIVEFFRQPDAQFVSRGNPLGHAYQWGDWGLTMGQTLSLPMILIGLVLVLWPRRKT